MVLDVRDRRFPHEIATEGVVVVGRRQRRLAALAVIAVLVAAAALPAHARAMGQVHCAGSRASLVGAGDARSVGDLQVDPIAERGTPVSMHMHQFSGSTSILGLAHPELASYTDLEGTPTSCDILADSALYWNPLLTRNGVAVPLSRMEAYYMAWDGALTDSSGATRKLPADLRMIAGNMMAASPMDMDLNHVFWDCGANSTKPGSLYHFATPAAADCATASGRVVLSLAVTFPSCWDGMMNDHSVLHDTSDYTGNMMSRAVGHLAYRTSTGCPSAFPIKLMTLRENISWNYAGDGTDVTLSSGPGYTAHADFLNSWVTSGITAMLSHCINTSLTDARTHTLYPGICGPPLTDPLASIVVSPSPATIVPGGSQTFRAEGFDKQGNDIGDETGVTTFSIDGTGSCVGATCTASDPGSYTVTATTTDGVATKTAQLNVVAAPLISAFTPTHGNVGTSVAIAGSGFTGTSAVRFNGAAAAFTVTSDAAITATVPAAASTGKIAVVVSGKVSKSSSPFYVVPTISGFSPTSGRIGTSVAITGTGFTNATKVLLAGVAATYSVASPTKINAIVPSGATTGKITVRTAGGSATSTTNFTILTSALTTKPHR
jgi:hypothetical protein